MLNEGKPEKALTMLDAEWSRYVSKDEPRLAEFQACDDVPRPVFERDERRGGCLGRPEMEAPRTRKNPLYAGKSAGMRCDSHWSWPVDDVKGAFAPR